ncbi:MAG: hypothetical protein DPW21_07195 [Anaerolineae bacterium]|nr:hypothetical protein [Chloroflexi bacterium CFX1]MCQ3946469.1 hypothetical protein [Anaerolineae bacterium]
MKTRFFSVFLLAALIAAMFGAGQPTHAQAQALDPASLLNPDGTLDLTSNPHGVFDLRGWDVTLDTLRGPILTPSASAPAAPDALTWTPLARNGLNNFVTALAVSGGDLYVGGDFTKTGDDLVTGLNRIAKYSGGAWSPLANQGLSAYVEALAVSGSDLYVGGEFTKTGDGTMTLNSIAKLTATTASVATFRSAGAQDGWVLESSETSNKGGTLNSAATTFRLGDDAARKQYRAILSFNTSGLPDNAVITKVTLKIKRQGVTGGGNPVNTFQGFMADVKKGMFGTSALQAADFQTAANKTVDPLKPTPNGGWYTLNLTGAKAFINKLASNGGLTQIRLRFKLDDNNNAVANYLSLFSGNAPLASRPQLIVEYYVP